jgi:hypothetical protein
MGKVGGIRSNGWAGIRLGLASSRCARPEVNMAQLHFQHHLLNNCHNISSGMGMRWITQIHLRRGYLHWTAQYSLVLLLLPRFAGSDIRRVHRHIRITCRIIVAH